jgi:resuscitation-promoting factor RpfB
MTISKRKGTALILLAVITLISIALVVFLHKQVTLTVDGESQILTTYALKVGNFLHGIDIPIAPQDELSPLQDAWLKENDQITLLHAIPVQIFADGKMTSILSAERIPTNLLTLAGITLGHADQVLSNGQLLDPNLALPDDQQSISLQVIRALSYSLTEEGSTHVFTSTIPTLGSALWSTGYSLFAADQLTPPADTILTPGLAATINRSSEVTIHLQDSDVTVRTAASTVGDALEDAALPVQGLDYSLPSPEEPIPSTNEVRLVRVTEQVLVEQSPLPFETQFQAVSDLEIDNQTIIQPGEYGLTAQRVRVRYEDGQEVSRQVESEWVARQPVPRIVGYGTSVVMHTAVVDGVEIQYWRALKVWVTSYHPSVTGSNRTATGALVEKGVVGVNPNYIPYHTKMYIPGYGYGEALDTGNIGARWIDLAYPDDEYIPWHQYVTIYLLWPPPDNIVWIIP